MLEHSIEHVLMIGMSLLLVLGVREILSNVQDIHASIASIMMQF